MQFVSLIVLADDVVSPSPRLGLRYKPKDQAPTTYVERLRRASLEAPRTLRHKTVYGKGGGGGRRWRTSTSPEEEEVTDAGLRFRNSETAECASVTRHAGLRGVPAGGIQCTGCTVLQNRTANTMTGAQAQATTPQWTVHKRLL